MEQRSASTDRLPAGFRLCGRYVLQRQLATTALSTVYCGFDSETRTLVAIKRLSTEAQPGGLTRASALRVLEAEGQLLRAIDHPQVPRFYDFVCHGDDYFLITEYVAGVPLDALLEEQPPTRTRALAIGRSLCAVVEALHRAGIVHADIKPGNIIVQPNDRVVLLDFGLARRAGRPAAVAVAMGTPHYAPPEQRAGAPLDERSDIYALGCVLDELFTVGRCAALRQAIAPALASVPAERFAGVPALRRALGQAFAAEFGQPAPIHKPLWDAWTIAALLMVLLALAALLLH